MFSAALCRRGEEGRRQERHHEQEGCQKKGGGAFADRGTDGEGEGISVPAVRRTEAACGDRQSAGGQSQDPAVR